jgi:hypothetical protein
VILVDGGDFCPPAVEPEKIKARLIREVMDRMNYDVLAVGERELAYGYDFYESMMQGTKMKVLVANVTHGDEGRLGSRYVIIKSGGVKVGFVNVYDSNTNVSSTNVFEKHGYVVEDPLESLSRDIATVRPKCDVLILMAHAPWGKLNELLKQVSGVDFVIAVHDGAIDRKARKIDGTELMRPGNRGQHVCTAAFVVDPEGVIKTLDTSMLDVKTSLPEDPDIAAMVKEASSQYNEERRAQTISKMAEQSEKLKGDKFLSDAACKRCHEDIYQLWVETPHAHAYESLAEKGMERDNDCLSCHTTGFGKATGYVPPPMPASADAGPPKQPPGTPDLRNVQCEACHGMGTYHQRDEGDFLKVTNAECMSCHDPENSPDFDYKGYLPHVSCTKLLAGR